MELKDRKTQEFEQKIVDVYSLSGNKVDRFKLDQDIFSYPINKGLLHQTIVMYLSNQRQGNASTKTRANVRGGGKKPWRQKGTGRARAGSIRSPLWRGGGIVFGPHPRDFEWDIPKKMKRLALISSLSAKAKGNEIIVLEKDPEISEPKTKEIAKILMALKLYKKRNLYLYTKRGDNIVLSCRNIKNLSIRPCQDFNAYDVLVHSTILFSRDTHDAIVNRLKGSVKNHIKTDEIVTTETRKDGDNVKP